MTKVQTNIETNKSGKEKLLDLTGYRFKSRRKNPEFSPKKLIPLRACLIHNKASKNSNQKTADFFLDKVDEILAKEGQAEVYISTVPKWQTILEKPEMIDTGTGEIIFSEYHTDDFKASRNRKIKTIFRFTDFYEPLYQARKVSLLFHTFTRIEYAKQDMRTMLECVKMRYRALKRPIRGYLWVMELAKNEKMNSGYHVHYHLVVVIDRVKWSKIPDKLKFDDLWGQETRVEFITKTIKGYLSKYLSKDNTKILGRHHYAISRKLK